MYKALTSFAMNKKDYEEMDIRKGEVLLSDFASEEIINDLLEAGYIEEYDGSISITENGTYDVTDYDSADVNVSGGSATLQSKEVSITENGTTNVSADTGYDGLSGVEITTNVQPDLESKSITITENTTTTITPTQGKDGLSSVEVITNVSGSPTITDGSYLFYAGARNDSMSALLENFLPTNTVEEMFSRNTAITSIPSFNSTTVYNFQKMCYMCTNLVNVPVYNWNNASLLSDIFAFCNNLSDDSLNNIMESCISVTKFHSTLRYLGLSQAQATICQGLSNYTAFTNAGWTTGY